MFVFGPFKSYLRALIYYYTLMHSHTHITEHILPQFASDAWIKTCTPMNVLSGFRVTGIWSINRNIFSDDDFIGSTVIEKLEPTQALADGKDNMVDEASGLLLPTQSSGFDVSGHPAAGKKKKSGRPISQLISS